MQLHELPKIVRRKKRRGRGIAGRGAKSGRGMKGQRSRAGSHHKAGFEGGQTPLYMRLPKGRGTKQHTASQAPRTLAVPAAKLGHFADGSIVGPKQLREARLVSDRSARIKLVAGGSLGRKLTVRVHAATAGARAQIVKQGGTVDIISLKPR